MKPIINQLAYALVAIDNLIIEYQTEKATALENAAFDGEEDLLNSFYDKNINTLSLSKYQIASMMIKNRCPIQVDDNTSSINIAINDVLYRMPKDIITEMLGEKGNKIITKALNLSGDNINIVITNTDDITINRQDIDDDSDNVVDNDTDNDIDSDEDNEVSYEESDDAENNIEANQNDIAENAPISDKSSNEEDINKVNNENEKVINDIENTSNDNNTPSTDNSLFDGLDDFFDDNNDDKKENDESFNFDFIEEEKTVKENKEEDPKEEEKKEENSPEVTLTKTETNDKEDDENVGPDTVDFSSASNLTEFDDLFDTDEEKDAKYVEKLTEKHSDEEEITEDTNTSNENDKKEVSTEKLSATEPSSDEAPVAEPSTLQKTNNFEKFKENIFDVKQEKEEFVPQETRNINPDSKFNLSNDSFVPEKKVEETAKEEKPNFSSVEVDEDFENMMNRLQNSKTKREREELELKIKESQKKLEGDNIIDLSTGVVKQGTVDIEKALSKVNDIAGGVVNVSKNDKILEEKMKANLLTSDYRRSIKALIIDVYTIKIDIYDGETLAKSENVKLHIVPLTKGNGNSEIAAYLDVDGKTSISAIRPNGRTMLFIKGQTCAILAHGYWENNNFQSRIQISSDDNIIKTDIHKEEIRPMGIIDDLGHNVIVVDHATTIHVIPVDFDATPAFFVIAHKDYSVDEEVECLMQNYDGSVNLTGEKFNYIVKANIEKDIFEVTVDSALDN